MEIRVLTKLKEEEGGTGKKILPIHCNCKWCFRKYTGAKEADIESSLGWKC